MRRGPQPTPRIPGMKTLVNVSYVALGAAIGGVLRYLLTVYVQGRTGSGFPIATLLINVSGSLLLGFLSVYFMETRVVSPTVALIFTTGLCGGYTTFSTFTYETFGLLRSGEYSRAGVYVTLSVVLSLIATIGGFAAARGAVHLQRGM